MRTFTLKGLFLTTVFILLGCLAVHAEDDGLITEQVVVKLDEAGTLQYKIDTDKENKITNLKIIGDIEGSDVCFIRKMAGCDENGNPTDGKLGILDLSDARIVGGGVYLHYFYHTSDDIIGDYFFFNCGSLTSVVMPSSVTSIGEDAFCGCVSLKSVVIPPSVTSIGGDAFFGCTSLLSVKIPSGVTDINDCIFEGCSSLTSVEIPSSVTTIGIKAFKDCTSLKSVVIPLGVTNIEPEAFEGCGDLATLVIPSSVRYISYSAFKDCASLKSVVIPLGVTIIGPEAFEGCGGLATLVIPSSVRYIGHSAFGDCTSLKSVYVSWESPLDISVSTDEFKGIDKKACTLYVPRGTKADYWSSSWGEVFDNIVEYAVTGIDHLENGDDAKELSRYAMNGLRLDAPAKGLNIVKYSDGSVKKVVVQ